jgi:hypothetical protein
MHMHIQPVSLDMPRIHVILDEETKARYATAARRAGQSLGGWLREAAEQRLQRESTRRRITSAEELRSFFDACDADQTLDREPDWEEQRRLIAQSRTASLDVT